MLNTKYISIQHPAFIVQHYIYGIYNSEFINQQHIYIAHNSALNFVLPLSKRERFAFRRGRRKKGLRDSTKSVQT